MTRSWYDVGVQFFFYCLCVGGESDAEILGVWGLRFVGEMGWRGLRYGGPIS